MPKIAEIKVIDNEIWVRIGTINGMFPETGSVSIYTEDELWDIKQGVALHCIKQIKDMIDKNEI